MTMYHNYLATFHVPKNAFSPQRSQVVNIILFSSFCRPYFVVFIQKYRIFDGSAN